MLLIVGDHKSLRLAKKKVYFFMIWSNENTHLLSNTKLLLDLEIGMSAYAMYL